jgi:hypothetical protein
VLLVLVLLALPGTAGCGSRTYPVEGRVVFRDGKEATELAGGFVTFEAEESQVSAQGEIQPDGTFRMGTFKPGDGAVPGRHKVLVMPRPADNPDRPPPPVLHPRYQRLETSGLEVTVEPKKNQVTLTVERARR